MENKNSADIQNVHGSVVQAHTIHGGVHFHTTRATLVRPHQLPLAPSRLIGRDEQFARLDENLNYGGIALISGMAGVGKTALATYWAHHAMERFPDGQLFIDLRAYGHEPLLRSSDVLAMFLRALGNTQPDELTSISERESAFRTLMSGRRAIVVLDNAISIAQVRPLLPGEPKCAVVITSRNMLTGLGVHFPVKDIHLERLGPTEALTILADASGTAVDLGSSALQTLVQRCDGLPLALRITGRRISKLSAANLLTVASELDSARAPLDFFQLSDDPSSRLRDVFSWSYKKLDTTVQKMFQMFGVTPSLNLDQTAASAISGYPIEIASQALRSLADSHLLVETTLNRYEPHDLLRSYAREMAVNRSDILSRTFNYYINTADYADDLVAPQRYRPWRNSSTHNKFTDRSVALEWLNAELSNIVSLCEEDDERHDRHRWRLAYAVRGYFYFTKRFDAWIRTHTAALAAAIRLGDARAEALTRNNLGMALMGTGELTTAAAHYRQAEELFYAEEDRHGWSNALVNLAAVLRRQGNCDEALTLQKKALAFYRERGLSRNIGITLRSMAQVEVEMGMTREAIKHVEEAISLAVTINLYLDAAQACNRLGLIHQITKQYAVAEIAHHLAIDYSKKVDGRHEEGIALWNLGKLARLTDNHKGETTWLSAAYVLFNAIGAKEALDVAEELSISST